jgi:putative phage-type endonuclease
LKKIVDKRKMTESDWDLYRSEQNGIGGSEVAIILGLSPYKSKFELWLEKTKQIKRPQVNNNFVEWGNILEPVVREKFRKETGFKVFQNNFVLQHDIHDFMIANIDGEVIDPNRAGRGILEIKTTREHNRKDWEHGCPIYYQAQCQHYMAVTGYEYAYICCLIGGNTFVYHLIERDDWTIDKMIQAEMEFMHQVKNRIAPMIGHGKSETDWLHSIYPNAIEDEMFIPVVIEELALEYMTLSEQVKAKTFRMDEIKNQIKLEGKEFKTLRGNRLKISMPAIQKILFDSKKFSEDHPDLYNQYKTKESNYRGFDVSMLK